MQVLKGVSSEVVVRAVPSAGKGVTRELPSQEALALARAEQEIARLTSAIDKLKTDAARAERDALERGRSEGLKDAAKAADERVRVLEAAVQAARQTWEAALRSSDALAVELVRTALAKIFEPSDDMAALTVRAVRRKVAEIEQGSVTAVIVSAADFPANADLASLETVVAPLGAGLDRSRSLRSGECRIELRVGERAIGPHDQWSVLARILDEFASGGLTA